MKSSRDLFCEIIRCFRHEALNRMIEIRRSRRELLLTTGTPVIPDRRNPAGAVLSPNMYNEIGFHLTRMSATGTRPQGPFRCMHLRNMLLESTLLNERLSATRLRTDMIHLSGMFLHMIEHRILTILSNTAL